MGFGFVSLLTTRYYYSMFLLIEYFAEPISWNCVRAILHNRDSFVPAAELTLISYDLTFEVELAGAFLGFFGFHYYYNKAGIHLLGTRIFVILLAGVLPCILVSLGIACGGESLTTYLAFWIAGVKGGLIRTAAIASIFVQRLPTWKYLLQPMHKYLHPYLYAMLSFFLSEQMFAPLIEH